MFETTVKLKPREQWRPGMTPEKIVEELDRAVKIPGLSNIWIPPIRNRIDMLATGIKSPIGVKVTGNDLHVIDRIAAEVEHVAKGIPGVSSSLAERLTGGRYVDVQIDRVAAGRYGLNVADVQAVVAGAIGGETVSETVEGLARFPINLRYPREWRDSPQRLAQLPISTPMGQQITLGTVARIAITDGPPMLKSENARPSGWVYVDVRGRDLVRPDPAALLRRRRPQGRRGGFRRAVLCAADLSSRAGGLFSGGRDGGSDAAQRFLQGAKVGPSRAKIQYRHPRESAMA